MRAFCLQARISPLSQSRAMVFVLCVPQSILRKIIGGEGRVKAENYALARGHKELLMQYFKDYFGIDQSIAKFDPETKSCWCAKYVSNSNKFEQQQARVDPKIRQCRGGTGILRKTRPRDRGTLLRINHLIVHSGISLWKFNSS
jgi:hypothetical protein